MSVPNIKFNPKDKPEFFKEVNSRVNAYFKETEKSRHANFNMKFKTFFMLALYFTPLVLMLTGVVTSLWGTIGMWSLMGLGMSGIGLSIMHDANHGSYSKSQFWNKVWGFTLNFGGGYPMNWKIQHNVLHHSFTNIEGWDEDIEKGVMRFSPTQKRKKAFKYQIFYAPILYGLLTTYWLIAKDYEQLVRYNKKGLLEAQGLTFKKALFQIILHKTWYAIMTIVLPIILLPLVWWQVILGFLLMQFIAGLILALIFQPAHVIEETEFYVPDENISIENSWAIHQMKTTSNFANGSYVFSWLIGGLNYQIEHHLFPNVCHVHYRNLAPIVKEVAEKYQVPYYHHKTFFGALKSHFNMLNELGTGKYDEKQKEAALAKQA
ncbi:MAG: acyl-CoA desaturase [Crocinitomicaceae bacterium]|nr:acyl-CoA desaturase [Crocinitomicaceae bacterium]